MVTIKSDREIALMREAGKVLGETHKRIGEFIKPGVSTLEIDNFAKKVVSKYGCTCSFFGLYDFPRNFCISVNDEIIHGIPDKHKIIKEGDVVKIDGGVCYKGYQSDDARTHIVGKVDEKVEQLVQATKNAFFEGIKKAVPGNHIQDIGAAIETYIKPYGYGILEDYTGHGIGEEVHEDPEIPNFKDKVKGPIIKKNMTFAVEPMITMGSNEVYVLDNDWTVCTVDGSMTAHYENTILVTDGEPEILTLIE